MALTGRDLLRWPARAAAGVLVAAALTLAGTGAPTAGAASAAGQARISGQASPAQAAPPYSCAPNGPAGNQTVYGTFGDASVVGWTGNSQAVVACLDGSFFVTSANGPGSGSTAPVAGTTYGYGIYNDSPTTWSNSGGYLPALVTTFHSGGARISITNFGDQVTVGGHDYVAVYSRVQVSNPTSQPLSIDPEPSPGLISLDSAPTAVPPHGTSITTTW